MTCLLGITQNPSTMKTAPAEPRASVPSFSFIKVFMKREIREGGEKEGMEKGRKSSINFLILYPLEEVQEWGPK